jgi:hypothetical protein
MCLECVGFDRNAITECTAPACPLWNFRPFQPGEVESDDDEQPASPVLAKITI